MIAICCVLITFILGFLHRDLNILHKKLDKLIENFIVVEKVCPVFKDILQGGAAVEKACPFSSETPVKPLYPAPNPISTLLNR